MSLCIVNAARSSDGSGEYLIKVISSYQCIEGHKGVNWELDLPDYELGK